MTRTGGAGGAAVAAAKAAVLPLALAQFVASYAGSNMNVAISTIANDLGTSVTGIQTTITLFTLTMAALMIPGSKLTDIWGRKFCFLLGLVIYGAGALLASFAQGLPLLMIGYSLLEGVGSALLIPPIYILITMLFDDTTDPRQVLRRGQRRRRDRRRGGAPDRRARHQLHQLAGVVHPAGVDRGRDHLAGPRHRRSAAARAAARIRLARRGALGAGPVLRGVRGPAERGLRMGHGHAGLRDRRHRDHPPGRDLARVALRGYRRGHPGPVHRLRRGRGRRTAAPRWCRSGCSPTSPPTWAC